uniref:Uncharacterized protein n=1 Tax=Megaselia scalaris TaxID=36166 RepID=T1GX40_MEGSC
MGAKRLRWAAKNYSTTKFTYVGCNYGPNTVKEPVDLVNEITKDPVYPVVEPTTEVLAQDSLRTVKLFDPHTQPR